MRFILAAMLTLVFAADVDAFKRRRGARRYNNYYSYNTGVPTYPSSNIYASPQAAAEAKAAMQANSGNCFHPGGDYGGAYAEGVGSGYTAQQALNNCCFTGQRTVAGQCVTQGSNGMYYACKTFW